MAIYIPHRLSADFNRRGNPILRDFASRDIANNLSPVKGVRQLQPYDSARSIINEVSSGMRNIAPLLILVDDREFDWRSRSLHELSLLPVRWVERFGRTLILHGSVPPPECDGTLIYYAGARAALGTSTYIPGSSGARAEVHQLSDDSSILCCEGDLKIIPQSRGVDSDSLPAIDVFTDGRISAPLTS